VHGFCTTYHLLFGGMAFSASVSNGGNDLPTYQADYPDALRGGLNGWYAIGHLLLLCGFIAGFIGVVLVCCKNRRGLAPLAASAPLIALGASLLAPEPAYPSLEPSYLVILWCSASAAWASAVTLATFLR
jgi:hypothetical protein